MNYHNVIYGSYKKSNYPKLLANYIRRNHFDCPIPKYKKILDVGCGNGEYVSQFKSWFYDAEGLDCEIDFNKDRFPYKDETFDFLFTKSVIEHVSDTFHFLKECYRVLKPQGKILILTPAWEYNYRWFYDDPTHVTPFHRKGLQDAMRLCNFDQVVVDYFYHIPLFWEKPFLSPLAAFVRLLPDDLRWKDWEQQDMNVFIRFCKEVQLMSTGVKEININETSKRI